MEVAKWFLSSSGMSQIALICSVLVLITTFFSSFFKDKEIRIERSSYEEKLNKKQSEIIDLQNQIINDFKAPHFEISSGKLLKNGKLEVKVKNVSNVYFRSFIPFFSSTYAIRDKTNTDITPYQNELESSAFKYEALTSFTTLDPSGERTFTIDLFPEGELEKLSKSFGPHLRKNLNDGGLPDLIRTVRSAGYSLDDSKV